jgi:hypothetical protein
MIIGIVAGAGESGGGGGGPGTPTIDLDFVNAVYLLGGASQSLGYFLEGDVSVDAGGLAFDNAVAWTPCVFTAAALADVNASSLWTFLVDFDSDIDNVYPFSLNKSDSVNELHFNALFTGNNCDMVQLQNGIDYGQIGVDTTLSSTVRQVMALAIGNNNPGAGFNGANSIYWGVTAPPTYHWDNITLGGFPGDTYPSFKGRIKRFKVWPGLFDVYDVSGT